MPGALKTHSAVFVQAAARKLLEAGATSGQVFRGTGFGPELLQEDAPEAPFRDVAEFFEHAAEVSENELFGFQFGLQEDLRSAGLPAYAALSAPDAAGFLTNFSRYLPLYGEAAEADVSRLAADGTFEWRYRVSSSLPTQQYSEFFAACLLSALRTAAQRRLRPVQAWFQHGRRSGIPEIEAGFGCRTVFGAARNGIRFQHADLARPLAAADGKLLKVLQHCGEQFLAGRQAQAPGLAAAVEQAIAGRLATGPVTLETIASGLGMSPRTLSRKLAQEGTSYFTILEELRKSLALRYLADKDLVLAEIAFLLGYSSLSSFNDAFKRWTGVSPGQYRGK
ncbi:AraC family transcriptional regulator ligand-binding domain-containing protein [Roseobacteraceae bacterium NS-SX3]